MISFSEEDMLEIEKLLEDELELEELDELEEVVVVVLDELDELSVVVLELEPDELSVVVLVAISASVKLKAPDTPLWTVVWKY